MSKPKEVSTDDFIRFLNATRPNSSCPGCGKSPSKWALCSSVWEGNPDNPDGILRYMEPMFHRFRTQSADGSPYGVTTYGMFCTNCGHFEQVMTKVVTNWLNLQEAEVGDDNA